MSKLISKKYLDTLKYWANVGYASKGKEYHSKHPRKKDPWYKINEPESKPLDVNLIKVFELIKSKQRLAKSKKFKALPEIDRKNYLLKIDGMLEALVVMLGIDKELYDNV